MFYVTWMNFDLWLSVDDKLMSPMKFVHHERRSFASVLLIVCVCEGEMWKYLSLSFCIHALLQYLGHEQQQGSGDPAFSSMCLGNFQEIEFSNEKICS